VKSIVFTGGGTGGHVYPGIAAAEKLRPRIDTQKYRIVWIGSPDGMEREIVSRFSLPFYGIPAGKLRRYFSLRNFLDVAKVAGGYAASLALLKRLDAALVFSKGGFVSVPPVAAARSLGIPAITHESDLDPGLATRINARFCRKMLCAYEETAADPGMRGKAVVTGNPVRAELFEGDRRRGREIAGVPNGKRVVLVLGGSQGARQINRMIEAILERLLDRAFVVHQMGSLDYEELGPSNRPGEYLVQPVFTDTFPHLLAAADLVVSRAGAGTLWESGVFGKASLLIPLGAESSRGDQLRNARYFASRGAAELLSGEDTNAESLLEKCGELLEDDERRDRMGQRAAELCPPDAAERIADEILSAIGEQKGSEV
jgi:UDP-N-acetylglucosamine--N-acetylmuramyl-(pentapeptide) pyrophosphoryl-undecaprenol N-acetylglucosamine transferase